MAESLDLNTITTADLRDQASPAQIEALESNPRAWLDELTLLKRKTETQMTSSKTRAFENHLEYTKKNMTLDEYNDKVYSEKVWKTNASRFIQQIEMRMVRAKQLQREA